MFCKYKDVLGKPGEGFHERRILGMAANDLIGTIIIMVIISVVFKINFLIVFLVVSLLTIFMHRIFCVNTTINKKIFGEV